MPPESRDIEPLRRMCARIRAGNPPGHAEIEQALEAGFGRLIALEAQLGRVRSGASSSEDGTAQALLAEIEVLREALTDLRTLSSPPGPPRIGYGFVLPRQKTHGRIPGPPRTPGYPQHS